MNSLALFTSSWQNVEEEACEKNTPSSPPHVIPHLLTHLRVQNHHAESTAAKKAKSGILQWVRHEKAA